MVPSRGFRSTVGNRSSTAAGRSKGRRRFCQVGMDLWGGIQTKQDKWT